VRRRSLWGLPPFIFLCCLFRTSKTHGYAAVVAAFTAPVLVLGTFTASAQGSTAAVTRIQAGGKRMRADPCAQCLDCACAGACAQCCFQLVRRCFLNVQISLLSQAGYPLVERDHHANAHTNTLLTYCILSAAAHNTYAAQDTIIGLLLYLVVDNLVMPVRAKVQLRAVISQTLELMRVAVAELEPVLLGDSADAANGAMGDTVAIDMVSVHLRLPASTCCGNATHHFHSFRDLTMRIRTCCVLLRHSIAYVLT
jgi:hypothetical protein